MDPVLTAGDVMCPLPERHRLDQRLDHRGGLRTDDVRAQQQAGFRVGQHLDETGRVLPRPAGGSPAVIPPADDVRDAALLRLLLGETDRRDLRLGEHRGGDEAVIESLKPLFAAMGKVFFRLGETGMGQSAKLVMNLQIALIYEGFAEGLTLATKLGVDVEKLMPVIQASMIRSGVVDYKAPFVLKRDFTPNFPLRLMHKDIRLTLEAAKEVRVKLPALETVEEIYELASEDGHQDLDYAATLTLLEKWAGVEVKGASA